MSQVILSDSKPVILFDLDSPGYNKISDPTGHRAAYLRRTSSESMQKNGLSRGRLALAWMVACYLMGIWLAPSHGADHIVLRDTTILTDQTVAGLDPDGVRFEDGAVIGWDRIDQGRVSEMLQPDFDKYLAQLGPHLYRIRQRLRVRDYRDLLPTLEAVYPEFKSRTSATSYMVAQARMWTHLARGEREAALEPYLRCFEMQRALASVDSDLPGRRRLQFDAKTGLSAELVPIWFNEDLARKHLESVGETIKQMRLPRPDGAYLYYATLAIRAGEFGRVERFLGAVTATSGPVFETKQIIAAQLEVRRGQPAANVRSLAAKTDLSSQETAPLALYWLGMADLMSDSIESRNSGLLRLLQIPAIHGKAQPELAAAALFRATTELEEMGDADGSVAVRNELLDNFGQTYFANQTRAASGQR